MAHGGGRSVGDTGPDAAGLIDEYRLFVNPGALGAGTPFFQALDDRIALKLLDTRTFGSGVVYPRYEAVSPAR